MQQIQIPIGAEGDRTYKEFVAFCKHYGCTVAPKKRGDAYWTISSDDPMNFYWLGANMAVSFQGFVNKSDASCLLKPIKQG